MCWKNYLRHDIVSQLLSQLTVDSRSLSPSSWRLCLEQWALGGVDSSSGILPAIKDVLVSVISKNDQIFKNPPSFKSCSNLASPSLNFAMSPDVKAFLIGIEALSSLLWRSVATGVVLTSVGGFPRAKVQTRLKQVSMVLSAFCVKAATNDAKSCKRKSNVQVMMCLTYACSLPASSEHPTSFPVAATSQAAVWWAHKSCRRTLLHLSGCFATKLVGLQENSSTTWLTSCSLLAWLARCLFACQLICK